MASANRTSIWRPYTQEATALPALPIDSASGAYFYTKEGQRIFDGISSWWLITHGHCQPEIVEAVQKQAAKLDQVTFANFTHEPAEELAELLIEMTPATLTRVFFSDNGSTAVEVALKMATQACSQSGKPGKRRFLAFEGAYHGDTVGAMSVSARSSFNRAYKDSLFEVVRAKHPTKSTENPETFLSDFKRLIEIEHKTLAGVIVEPLIQGAGGMTVWPEAALRDIARLCKEHGVFLIFDEVMTGFGRTGRMFAMDRLGISPDLLCLSKGLTGGTLPLAATIATEEIYSAFLSKEKERMFFHGHSFTGNPISCAAGVASLRLFKTGNVVERLASIEETHHKGLANLGRSVQISDPRVCGTIAAFECGTESKNYLSNELKNLVQMAIERGLFIRPLGNTVYLMPPYSVDTMGLMQAWEILTEVTKLAVGQGPMRES